MIRILLLPYMKLILFLAVLWTSNALIITINRCSTTLCSTNLFNYVSKLSTEERCLALSNSFALSVSHPKPPIVNTDGLTVIAYAIDATYTLMNTIDNLSRTDANDLMHLNVDFPTASLGTNPACITLSNTKDHYMVQCKIALRYIGNTNYVQLKVAYKQMTVLISRSVGTSMHLAAGPIYQNGCNCNIIIDAKYTSKIYKGSQCNEMIESGDVLAYGEQICLEFIAMDADLKKTQLNVSSIKAIYKNKEGKLLTAEMIDFSTVTCSPAGACENGKVYAIVPLYVLGEVSFKMTVTSKSSHRILPTGGEVVGVIYGVIGAFDAVLNIVDIIGFFSFSSSVVVSALSVLAIMMLIL